MRGLFVALGFLAAVISALPAQAQESPDEIVRSIYAAYEGQGLGVTPADPGLRDVFSPRLQALLAEEQTRIDEDGIGLLDFDVFVDGQDFDLTDLKVAAPKVSGDAALVTVSFLNFGEPRDFRYSFVMDAGNWRIDEIESVGGGADWKLSELLAAN